MNITLYIIIVVLALAVAGLIAMSVSQRRAAAGAARDLQASQERILTLTAEREKAMAENQALRTRAQEERENLEQLQGSFRAEFRNLANDIMEEKSRQFKETNKESMELLLKPFRINITEFRERVEKIYSDENQQRGALKSEINRLMELNRVITEETSNLTNALKGNSKVQGDWGEVILQTILESSNLTEGIHYTIQENLKDAAGNNLRPDVILSLPDKKHIVIDSKVSLTAFVDYSAADDAPRRDAALKAHLVSVRKHVSELGSKNYQSLLDSPDFVIMFVPNEPAFLSALQSDPAIWSEAYNKKVIISSPTNLFALLKIVYDLWRRDDQNRNSIAIAEEAGRMYDKLVGFVETLGDIGKHIDRAQSGYDKALKQLQTGPGNLITRSEKLREMGAKALKKLPAQLTDNSEE